jgi:hypothetical protein
MPIYTYGKRCFLKSVAILTTFAVSFLTVSCAPSDSVFYNESLVTPPATAPLEDRIVISTNIAGQYALVMYSIDGEFIQVLHDYIPENLIPRGLVAMDSTNFLVATAGVTQIQNFNLLDGITPYVMSVDLTGNNIFQMRRHPTLGTFVIEGNNIESFNDDGNRIGAPRIPASVGACTLSVPRGMAFTASGLLAIVNTTNDDLNLYDVTDPLSPVCMVANTSFGNADPVAVLAHSDGFLYVATQGDDRIYRFAGNGVGAPTVIFSNTGIILDPTALLEMPDGTILVASDGTNSIVHITTSGALVGVSNNFISDTFTNSVSDMIILPGDQ